MEVVERTSAREAVERGVFHTAAGQRSRQDGGLRTAAVRGLRESLAGVVVSGCRSCMCPISPTTAA